MDDVLGSTALLVGARALLLLGITGLVGVASLHRLVPGAPGRGPRWEKARHGLGVAFAAATLVALFLSGAAQFALFRDPWAPWQEDALLLLGSPWGKVWIGAAALTTVVTLLRIMGRGRGVAALGAVILAGYPAMAGHAAAAGELAGLAMLSQWLHVLAAGGWMGALAVLVLIGGARGGTADESDRRAEPLLESLERFSAQARISVATIVLTGAFATWLHLGEPSALVNDAWGRLLATKLSLVALVLALGFRNWRVLSPTAHEPEGMRRLLVASRVEAIFGALVVAVSAWLATTSPPG